MMEDIFCDSLSDRPTPDRSTSCPPSLSRTSSSEVGLLHKFPGTPVLACWGINQYECLHEKKGRCYDIRFLQPHGTYEKLCED